jgi:superfamily II DNA or RNA helicase
MPPLEMASILRISFDRGILRLEGTDSPASLPGVRWDEATRSWQAPPCRLADILERAVDLGWIVDDRVAAARKQCPGGWVRPTLRPYQEQAIAAWRAFRRRGTICLPTGSGKTRVAVAALAELAGSALILCPTRALLGEWERTLAQWYAGRVGIVGDGERRIEAVTVMTFESAYRHMSEMGDGFETLVVDEVHHFGGGARTEALETCAATSRLGLTATAPAADSTSAGRIGELVGPVVCEVALRALIGTHLAKLETVCLKVLLDDDERTAYARHYRPFAELYASFVRAYPGAEWPAFVESLSKTAAGRSALEGYHLATRIACFPKAKRALTASLLRRHELDKTLVFTAFAEDAYTIAKDHLVPVITADVARRERDEILARFRDGRYRAIVSARVLNEGIDVPDANVAILTGGNLGKREYVQRIGRVLRPAPDKQALAYELVTLGTIDDVRARTRRRLAAA